MPIPMKRQPSVYEPERLRLLDQLTKLPADGDEYQKVMNQLDKLDKILNRTSELKKTVIPALGTVASVVSIYALQQFAGVIVPKALDTIASRSSQKTPKDHD